MPHAVQQVGRRPVATGPKREDRGRWPDDRRGASRGRRVAARASRSRRRSPARPRSSTCSPRTAASRPGPSELARRLGLPKSSIANICGALADAGLVRRVGTGFALGRRLAELGGAYLATSTWSRSSTTRARQLPTGSEETVQLAVLDGLEMTYLARHDGRQPVRLTSQIGRRLPATRHGDRQGGARVARPTPSSTAGWPGVTSCRR